MPTVTRGQIRAAAARLMGLLIAEGTTTAASNISITDASTSTGGLVSDTDSEFRFDGCYCLMTSGPANGTWREVSGGNYIPGSGVLQIATGWSPTPTATGGDTYEIYAGLTPSQWSLRDNNTILDFALQRCRYSRRSPITLVTDGDMEASGTAAWTNSNATLLKSTTDTVTSGAQSLLVTNTSPNGYAQSTPVPIIPTRGYQCWVDYRGTSATKSTATLQVWDITNSSIIATGTDPDSGLNFEGGRSSCGFTVPSNCYQIAFRLVGTESNAVIAWDDLIMIAIGRRRYATPSWILNRNQIMSYTARAGVRPFEDIWMDIGWPKDIQEDPTAVTTFIIDTPLGAASSAIYVTGEGAYGPQTSTLDATTTSCPLEWAQFAAAREAWQRYSRELEGASTQRSILDRAVIEKLASQKDNLYMPKYQSSIGMDQGYAGMEITRLP